MQWLDEDFADACDFKLLGLSSHLPPHRLAWELNQQLEWRLEFYKVLEIRQRQGHSEHVAYRFEGVSEHGSQMWYVIENKSPKGLVARFNGGSEMDYLVQVMDETCSMVEIMDQIRFMRGVNYIIQLDPLASGAIEHLALMDLNPAS